VLQEILLLEKVRKDLKNRQNTLVPASDVPELKLPELPAGIAARFAGLPSELLGLEAQRPADDDLDEVADPVGEVAAVEPVEVGPVEDVIVIDDLPVYEPPAESPVSDGAVSSGDVLGYDPNELF